MTSDPPDTRRTSPARYRLGARSLMVAAALVCASSVSSQEPTVTWQGERPDYIRNTYFADDPWGEPLRSGGGPEAERWGFYVWSGTPLWLVVEIDGAVEGPRLCAQWTDPNGDPAADGCQALPSGPARLSFEGPRNSTWPEGRYLVRLFLEAPASRDRDPVAEVSYALGDLPLTAGPGDAIPEFPWPPPRPTSQMVLERTVMAGGSATLGDVAHRLVTALGTVGYDDRSFYAVPGGFALATQLEQIDVDGTPKAEPLRWSAALPPRELFSLADFVRALFTAPEGHYRVIVFVVTDRPFSASDATVTREEASAWLRGGLNLLPPAIAEVPLTDRHAGTALVYQFLKIGHERDPIPNPDGAPTAVRQLEISGILAALAR